MSAFVVPRWDPGDRSDWRKARVMLEIVIALVGTVLLATAVLANQHWLDRHFLPSFFLSRHAYVRLETIVRLGMGMLGMAIALFVRRPLARFLERSPSLALHVVIAFVLAVGASELVLRYAHLRPAEWLGRDQEPKRQPDALLGWTFVPSRSARSTIGGRSIEYAFDAAGDRVRRSDDPVDPSRPTVLFTGESLMFGKGLTWQESIPAQIGAMMGIQSANLAVDGYGTDQAYLRLAKELPRYRRPVAVLMMFMTALFGRNLDDDRPHLGPGLIWLPTVRHSRLQTLGQFIAPYRRDETIERGISVTREVLRATIELARARGATPLILVPQLGPEDRVERTLRTRILDEPGLPYVFVEVDPRWRVPGDVHPDAHAAHVIAMAVAARLRKIEP